MIIIIPLGGIGKRFSELGYKDPKPLVKVLGKEIIFWVLDNLKINNKDKVYIVYNKELDNFDFTDHFGKYPYLNFLRLNRNTKGPVETIYEITKILEKNNNKEGFYAKRFQNSPQFKSGTLTGYRHIYFYINHGKKFSPKIR